MSTIGATAAEVKAKREEFDCGMATAVLEVQKDKARDIINRKYLIGDEYADPPVTDDEMWRLLTWLVDSR